MSMFSGGGCRVSICSAEATGFTLGLEQTEDVTLADGALNVTDEGTGGSGADKLDLHLGDATTGAGFANDFFNDGGNDFSGVHDLKKSNFAE